MNYQALSKWMRNATPEQREELAEAAETSVAYLYIIAGGHRDNFRLRLAHKIAAKTYEMHKITNGELPFVSLDDLYALTDRRTTER
jgi:hypothetical protein